MNFSGKENLNVELASMIGKVISNKDHKRASTMDQAPKPVRASYWNIKSDSTQLPTTIGTTDHNCPSSSPNSFFNILAEFKGVFLGMARSPTRKQYKQEKMMMENDKIGWVKAKQTPHINIYISFMSNVSRGHFDSLLPYILFWQWLSSKERTAADSSKF